MTIRVTPDTFVDAMEAHWEKTLGNTSSDNLRAVWRQMAEVFGEAIEASDQDEGGDVWRVLQPPTGAGKTQGLTVYASLVAKENVRTNDKVGVLVVTRLKATCPRNHDHHGPDAIHALIINTDQ